MKKLLLLWHLLSGHCSMWGVSVIFASPLLWSMGLIFFFFFRRTRFASWVPLAERMYNPPCMWKVQPHTFMNLPQKTVRFLGRGGDRWRGVYSRFLLVGLLQGFRLSAVTDGSNPHSHINGKSEDFMEANKRLPPGREPAGAPFSSTATLMAWQSSDLWIAYQQTSLSLSLSFCNYVGSLSLGITVEYEVTVCMATFNKKWQGFITLSLCLVKPLHQVVEIKHTVIFTGLLMQVWCGGPGGIKRSSRTEVG